MKTKKPKTAAKVAIKKPAATVTSDKQVPYDPAKGDVTVEPVKVRKSKKTALVPAALERIATPAVPVAATAAAPIDRKFTGESAIFNGVMMYEYRLEGSSRNRWTIEAPSPK